MSAVFNEFKLDLNTSEVILRLNKDRAIAKFFFALFDSDSEVRKVAADQLSKRPLITSLFLISNAKLWFCLLVFAFILRESTKVMPLAINSIRVVFTPLKNAITKIHAKIGIVYYLLLFVAPLIIGSYIKFYEESASYLFGILLVTLFGGVVVIIIAEAISAFSDNITEYLFPVMISASALFVIMLDLKGNYKIVFLCVTILTFQIFLCDGLVGLVKTPWRHIFRLPLKEHWLCRYDYHRPVFLKLSPWVTRWTNRSLWREKPPCAVDFSDHWRCPVCDRTDWLKGVGTVVGVIGGSLGQPVQDGDVLSLPLIGVDGRAVASDLDRIEVRSWPSGCHDVDVLNSVFIRFQYAARKPLKDVPIHLAPNVTLSDSARDLATRHFGSVVVA